MIKYTLPVADKMFRLKLNLVTEINKTLSSISIMQLCSNFYTHDSKKGNEILYRTIKMFLWNK